MRRGRKLYNHNGIAFFITENSFFARVAGVILRSRKMALTLGNTIHLTGVDAEVFLKNERWVKHEICHIGQYKRMGWSRFIFLYLISSIRYGYYRNPLEVEAREAEKQPL